jgi:phosphoribosylanthranilate isomerase
MPVTRIKVSGLTTAADAAAAVQAGADAVACVFNPDSPRYVTLEQAWSVRRAIPPGVLFVGIFADTPLPIVQRITSHCGLDRAQLFGRETRDEVDALRGAFKGVTVSEQHQVDEAARAYLGKRAAPPPELLLHLSGGLAAAWSVAAKVTRQGSVLLASSAMREVEHAAEAVRIARPWGIDVWDAVEAEPGRLDTGRLHDLVAAVRAQDPSRQKETA